MGIPDETRNMWFLKLWFLVASYIISIDAAERDGKAFSLFNVVTFKNEECIANSANDLRGTCYTTEECQERGGMASGGCAMGFGTCCLFAVDECGGTARENCSYIRNEGFPNTLTGEPDNQMCDFTVRKCADDVCSLRLDFNTFNIQAGTGGNAVAQDSTATCQDTFVAEVTGNEVAATFPVICGQNNDQHMFMEIGSDEMATLTFNFANIAATRQFEIKVTQYKCEDVGTLAPSGGCLQWHTGTRGQLTTFNWAPQDAQHLENQNYDICIRQESGFCCIEYSVCDQDFAFSLSGPTMVGMVATMGKGLTGSNCANDFIIIDGSSEVCGSAVTFNRYCGDFLSSKAMIPTAPATGVHNVICDCSSPFVVGISTNAAAAGEDDGMAAGAGVMLTQSRGLCLEYKQTPC